MDDSDDAWSVTISKHASCHQFANSFTSVPCASKSLTSRTKTLDHAHVDTKYVELFSPQNHYIKILVAT